MRTVVNVKSGGRTQLSGMIHAALLLAILLGLGSLVKYVPLSVLAGILITVGWGIIDFRGFKDLRRIPKSDAFVMIVVFLMTVFVDLLTAVGIGHRLRAFHEACRRPRGGWLQFQGVEHL